MNRNYDTEVNIEIDDDFSENSDSYPEVCENQISDVLQCVKWPWAQLTVSKFSVSDAKVTCHNLSLTASTYHHSNLSFCFPLSGKQLYGGSTVLQQTWPVQHSIILRYHPYLTGYERIASTAERFWITSTGEAIYVPPEIPLFVSQNPEQLCLESALTGPYHRNDTSSVNLTSIVCTAEDAKTVLLAASPKLLGNPTVMPDNRMLQDPVWSTWARYKKNITDELVLEFAEQIKQYGFSNSQLEIDDAWETCYGDQLFNLEQFPNAEQMVSRLHDMGFRVTLWIHPFKNHECKSYQAAKSMNILVSAGESNETDTIKWWNGRGGMLDFTNELAMTMFTKRLNELQRKYGIDGFKFDAGEVRYVPLFANLHGNESLQPVSWAIKYAETIGNYPGLKLSEMRSLFLSQKLPIAVRMDDKDSTWFANGLQTLIPSLLVLNTVGYSFVMPDMIGGNGYGIQPDKELYIRWLQASTFMPILQFSYVPWDFDEETVTIAQQYVSIRSRYKNLLVELAQQRMFDGTPINLPVWWIDPHDSTAQTIDSEYMLGDKILVAPVLHKGSVSRDIYLPAGTWREVLRSSSKLYQGPVWLHNHSAPLNYLPFFELIQIAQAGSYT